MDDPTEKALMERVAVTRKAYVDARAKLLDRKKAGESGYRMSLSVLGGHA